MEYARTYTHKTFGEIGRVILAVDNKGRFTLNGTELPQSSIDHLLGTYALQTLQDAYAGAKSSDEALGAFNGKLDKLLNGTIGTRGSGDGVDERTRVARSIVMASYKASVGAKSPEWAAFDALSDDEKNAKLDANYAANAEALDPVIDERIAAIAAAREAKKALAKAITFEM